MGTYSYPVLISNIAADVAAVATELAQRQSDTATTNGGIQANGGATPVPQLGVDPADGGITYLKAIADVGLATSGFQQQFADNATSTTTTSGAFVTCSGIPTLTFNVPIAKTYLVHVDLGAYQASNLGFIYWELVFSRDPDDVAVTNASWVTCPQVLNQITSAGFRAPVAFTTSGSWTCVTKWRTTTDAAINGSGFYSVTLTG